MSGREKKQKAPKSLFFWHQIGTKNCRFGHLFVTAAVGAVANALVLNGAKGLPSVPSLEIDGGNVG